MNQDDIVTPVAFQHTNEAWCFPPWYVQGTEYRPALATYQPLVNGEETFRAVHQAIARATKTVDIICWGFQPSMFLMRENDLCAPSIGQLLMLKAEQGVQVRVLAWEAPLNTAGYAGEANLPGKGTLRLWSRALQHSTEEQYAFDKYWYATCAIPGDEAIRRLDKGLPLFVTRGFDRRERFEILHWLNYASLDPGLRGRTKAAMFAAPSHHQKTVLVDYEVPDRATGFVMGHNLLDEYWDTDEHLSQNRTPQSKPAPDQGARGKDPRQDISCQISGPILEHLHDSFAVAWRKETGEDLLVSRNAGHIGPQQQCIPEATRQVAQILVTQAQTEPPPPEQDQPYEGKREIERLYLQAVNNATRFIYIENQYFRWPVLAEKIKEVAAALTRGGSNPGVHGALHLFVITNATEDGIGPGTVNTQRMLESLGRADTMPNITKLHRLDQVKRTMPARPNPDFDDLEGQKELEEWENERTQRRNAIKGSMLVPQSHPGLKMHICSLVAPDSPAGMPWKPVYIHSKLMIVDDVFTTQGSTNINTRSMQVDSELNIAHDWASVTKALRRRLWDLHTKGRGAQDDEVLAFAAWGELIQKNRFLLKEKEAPSTPLVEFYYDQAQLTDDD
ncbi:phospholipase [Pseudomonas sp. Leaf127]|uniref:phospholipase D-like domain-containing protein n=1 Tax=Pseudomonas sp. Leaf127 TaxID=1736267 RepID=UPI0007027689|nr:hypothetical protein [Pseudomonas sp. Leaf127]KQQ56034.1 phospholipase [Pseudomonas sp. Leaf127]